MDDKQEFYIVGVERHKSAALVSGRCGYVPIRVGDVFTVVFCYERDSTGNELLRVNVRTIDIRIKSIILYGEFASELSPSYTAVLELKGTGINVLGNFKHEVISTE